jgi:hypothetical protein
MAKWTIDYFEQYAPSGEFIGAVYEVTDGDKDFTTVYKCDALWLQDVLNKLEEPNEQRTDEGL